MKDLKKEFAKNLKDARAKAGLTQLELAKLVGSKQNTISMYESDKGTQTPSLQLAYQIANALNVSIDWLCGIDPESNISSYQWLIYLDELVNNPPENQNRKTICLDDGLNNGVALMFLSDEMKEFFRQYKALQELRNTLDNEVYTAARKALFEKNKKLFESGYKETVMGVTIAHPPVI